jgi:hypothetical protein
MIPSNVLGFSKGEAFGYPEASTTALYLGSTLAAVLCAT